MSVGSFIWDDDASNRLSALWGTGLSASKIAQQLGAGATKNAVIGKARRLGLPPRPTPIGYGASVYANRCFNTPEKVAQFDALIEEGRSYTEIGRIMGVSPDSVSDRARRHQRGFAYRPPVTLPPLASERKKEEKVHQTSMLDTLLFRAPVVPLPVFSRNATCQWIVSERPYRFCDKPAMMFQANGQKCPEGAIWCADCRKRIYVSRAQEQQDKAA